MAAKGAIKHSNAALIRSQSMTDKERGDIAIESEKSETNREILDSQLLRSKPYTMLELQNIKKIEGEFRFNPI